MLPKHKLRIELLKSGWLDFHTVRDHYGITFPSVLSRDLHKLEAFVARFFPKEELFRAPNAPGLINRILLERYLQWADVSPLKLAAAKLGMTEDSFKTVLVRMNDLAILDFDVQIQQFIDCRIIERFPKYFSSTWCINDDPNYRCSFLHDVIKKELDIEVVPLRCVTSQALGEVPGDFGYNFDVITDEPVGLRRKGSYQVTLDFGKPINLVSDRCSLLFYAQNEEELKPYVYPNGYVPEIPDALLKYTKRNPRRFYELRCEYPFGTAIDESDPFSIFGSGNVLHVRPLDTPLGSENGNHFEVCSISGCDNMDGRPIEECKIILRLKAMNDDNERNVL